ncbi:hypothetical protein WJX72_005023 [[Myrmecia] bisecta]|uniref:Uncharacterized protein n=1 Tax=[Myrmecia] bisecta TaxID=41462 RepID=A0AAW1QF21_9CHLO
MPLTFTSAQDGTRGWLIKDVIVLRPGPVAEIWFQPDTPLHVVLNVLRGAHPHSDPGTLHVRERERVFTGLAVPPGVYTYREPAPDALPPHVLGSYGAPEVLRPNEAVCCGQVVACGIGSAPVDLVLWSETAGDQEGRLRIEDVLAAEAASQGQQVYAVAVNGQFLKEGPTGFSTTVYPVNSVVTVSPWPGGDHRRRIINTIMHVLLALAVLAFVLVHDGADPQ